MSGFSSAPPLSAPALLRTNWAPGEPCSALFSDGQWHPATVQSAAPSGGFRVLFDHYAVPVTLPAASIRAAPRTGVDEARTPVTRSPVLSLAYSDVRCSLELTE